MLDVLIVGAGPAGSVAGAILARAGARVRIVDRSTFPRDKLCGDTINPGTLARLRSLDLDAGIDEHGLRVDGMKLTGARGESIEARYPDGLTGRALTRRDLDWLLLQQAMSAGCQFEPGVAVRRAIVDDSSGEPLVVGAIVGSGRREAPMEARVTIAADGRHSTIAFGLGLARHPARPRRWAIGAYFENFLPAGVGRLTVGEMHVRRGYYIGVAPVPGSLTNVCLVRPSFAGDVALGDPAGALRSALTGDPLLRDRAAGARLIGLPIVLGPLAVDVRDAAMNGLLLAGDAAGFIDPMTGDGLRFATCGGELAAGAALTALARGWSGVHAGLMAERRRAFGGKWRFNRAIRALVASPRAVNIAAVGARLVPSVVHAVVARAGDCSAAASP
jgi:flavin-dependent dehydrogenase